ncbi:hypothetical protein LEP1GSC059_3824 [Leptospira noguchii serovar Panama str. CZ214]|uniref:Uncharacterized protein n=1 Tax=Leptospira noguchii serovar Panama str. CZ214 TaxID=1001595 RepID=T0H395_9LEPT|nr:hypothetical protein LEP1GSC059_3824 [Leptospira noguchii serovar Panama str. CZ214]
MEFSIFLLIYLFFSSFLIIISLLMLYSYLKKWIFKKQFSIFNHWLAALLLIIIPLLSYLYLMYLDDRFDYRRTSNSDLFSFRIIGFLLSALFITYLELTTNLKKIKFFLIFTVFFICTYISTLSIYLFFSKIYWFFSKPNIGS